MSRIDPERSLADFANEPSEILFGYREARNREILDRVRALVDSERSVDVAHRSRGDRVREALAKLREAIEEGQP